MLAQLAPPPKIEPKAAPDFSIDLEVLARALCELGRVECLDQLGTAGPLLASAGDKSLFHCLFGRDALRMAFDLLDDFPVVARTTLLELARLQGVRHNPRAEEEPGRILHEHRHPDDPRAARIREHWDLPYYGAVDTTPQWINLLVAYCNRVSSLSILHEPVTDLAWRRRALFDSLIAAANWLLRRLDDPAGGGYMWVRRVYRDGIANQVWEDSADSHYHADGRLFDFTHAYAPVAVQGYVYDALVGAADLLDSASINGLPVDTQMLRQRASELRARTIAYFWQPDLGTFAQALTIEPDGSLRVARVVASSPGHLLASRMLDGKDMAALRARLAARLMQPDLLGCAGVRTKSTTSARFRPGAYHNGSVWPWDTGVIADGLRRHGFVAEAENLDGRIVRACAQVAEFPEFIRGDDGDVASINEGIVDAVVDGVPNRLEQPPQARQGWTVTRVWRIIRSLKN